MLPPGLIGLVGTLAEPGLGCRPTSAEPAKLKPFAVEPVGLLHGKSLLLIRRNCGNSAAASIFRSDSAVVRVSLFDIGASPHFAAGDASGEACVEAEGAVETTGEAVSTCKTVATGEAGATGEATDEAGSSGETTDEPAVSGESAGGDVIVISGNPCCAAVVTCVSLDGDPC